MLSITPNDDPQLTPAGTLALQDRLLRADWRLLFVDGAFIWQLQPWDGDWDQAMDETLEAATMTAFLSAFEEAE
jgi:hypothetical protein